MSRTATLRLQRWGNSLAVRIPSSVARAARFKVGQPVELAAHFEHTVAITDSGPRILTPRVGIAVETASLLQ